jgi:microcystin degradation protein MlrC
MTHYQDFDPVFGPAVLERHQGKLTEVGGFLSVLAEAGKTAAPVCAAWAITANRLVRPDFVRLVEEFSSHLAAIPNPEGLLLSMHGAQTAEGVDDVEGHLLGRAREILGPDLPIMVTLDLHANVTRAMVERATAICGYHTYPHVDLYETGQKAARLLLRTLEGKIRPVMAWRKLPLILMAENQQTTQGPAQRLFAQAEELERTGAAEAVSIFPVQPWMDIEEMGASVVVVIRDDAARADEHARALAQKLWDTRHEFEFELTPVEEAIRLALETEGGPVILSESSDSTGSGSPGDSTGVLKHLLKAPLTGPAAIFLVDPDAVKTLVAAGPGATMTLSMGGKYDTLNSTPVCVTGRVRMISDGRWTARLRGYSTGIETCMGTTVVFEAGMVRILIAERPAMTVDPELFRSHGLDPLYMKIVVVKSPTGFRFGYEPIAKRIFVVDTPGVSSANFAAMPFRRINRPIYPLDRDLSYKA